MNILLIDKHPMLRSLLIETMYDYFNEEINFFECKNVISVDQDQINNREIDIIITNLETNASCAEYNLRKLIKNTYQPIIVFSGNIFVMKNDSALYNSSRIHGVIEKPDYTSLFAKLDNLISKMKESI